VCACDSSGVTCLRCSRRYEGQDAEHLGARCRILVKVQSQTALMVWLHSQLIPLHNLDKLSIALHEVRDSLLEFDKNANDIELLIADCHNYEAMRQIVSQTKAIATTVGAYAL
jgi:hypothetical protein